MNIGDRKERTRLHGQELRHLLLFIQQIWAQHVARMGGKKRMQFVHSCAAVGLSRRSINSPPSVECEGLQKPTTGPCSERDGFSPYPHNLFL